MEGEEEAQNAMTIVGACPRCGSPIWSPLVWHGVCPPPATPSCSCFPSRSRTVTSTSSELIRWPPGAGDELE